MEQKINIRLSFIALLAVVFVTAANLLVFYNLFRTQITNDLKMNARMLMETEVFQREYDSLGNDPEKLSNSSLNKLKTGDVRLTWIAEDGTVLFDNDAVASGLANHLDRPEIREAMTNGEGENIRSSQTLGMDTYYYALRLENGTVLRVSTQAHAIAGVFFRSLPIVAVVALLILGICIVLGHALSRQIIQPIEKMAEEIDKPTSEPPYKELEPFAAKIRTQHENLLEAVKTRQDFTANVSHELKTPLTAISGYAELIENGLADPESEKHIAQQIRANSDRLLQLINDTIQLSRLDHGETGNNNEEIDLYKAASECCRNLKVSAERNNILLTCDGRSAAIRGDEEQIKELIENLVQNGIRYNNAGGYVRVSVRHEDGHAVLSVRDNGIGIAKEKQSRVFERFYRVDKSRSRDSGGTGLGLALVKHIAEIHNADIEMESTPGVGTVISVHFPEMSSVSIQSVS
ncbi:MAG: two-component sensor histidine kinase [Mogibacterium sp.]|nr:two-component sensor histidine kinase [Mogibacterium sp.]